MHAVVQKHFGTPDSDAQDKDNTYAECFTGHRRQEHRSYKVSPIPQALARAAAHWPGLASVVQVVRQRQQAHTPACSEVKSDSSVKIGVQDKRKRTGWSLAYLEQLL